MSGKLRSDIVRATSNWRKSGPRHDSVIVQGISGLWFAQIHYFFEIRHADKVYRVAYVRRFVTIGRDRTGFIQLRDHNEDIFVFTEAIIRSCHIVTVSPGSSIRVVQDLSSPDMYLRLNTVH